MDKQKVILLILDGWGYRKDTETLCLNLTQLILNHLCRIINGH